MTIWLILASVFIGVAALAGLVTKFFVNRQDNAPEERLGNYTRTSSGSPLIARGGEGLMAVALDEDESASKMEGWLGRFVDVRTLIRQSGVKTNVSQVVLATAGMAVVGGVLSKLADVPYAVTPIAAITLSTVPIIWLLIQRHLRLVRFEQQLPDAMDLLARSLRAGHSFGDGIRLISEEMLDPIAGEFRRCHDHQTLGRRLEDGLDEMTERIPSLDLRFFVTTVRLQRQTGGDSAEILEKIATLIRKRFQLRGQVRALTGEGRMSALVLIALPIVLTIYMHIRNPNHLRILVEDPLGRQMAIAAIVAQIIGAIVIKKIVSIRV